MRVVAEKKNKKNTLFPSLGKSPIAFGTPDYSATYDIRVQKILFPSLLFSPYHLNVFYFYEAVVMNYHALAFDMPIQDHQNKLNFQAEG